MKFSYKLEDCATTNKNQCSPLVERLLKMPIADIYEVVKDYDYDSVEELAETIRTAHYIVGTDRYLAKCDDSELEGKILRRKSVNILTAHNAESKIKAKAEELWVSHFEQLRLRSSRAAVLDVERKYATADDCAAKIADVYGFSDNDMDKFRYFICQCRRNSSDPLLNRSLYLYSKAKMTGKTTVANTIAGILNGCKTWSDAMRGKWQSSIAQELQFGNFDTPKACTYFAVVMDEAFSGKNTRKYYGKFKNAITSDKCTVEVKFGSKYDIACRRNYIFTSNSDVSSIVADSSERRIMVVTMDRQPKELPYDELYQLWYDYIVNVSDEEDVSQWYRATIDNVVGEDGKILEYYESALLSEEFKQLVNNASYQVSFPKFFVDYLSRDNSLHNVEIIKEAVVSLFGEPKRSSKRIYYNISDIRYAIESHASGEQLTVFGDETKTEDTEKLPF